MTDDEQDQRNEAIDAVDILTVLIDELQAAAELRNVSFGVQIIMLTGVMPDKKPLTEEQQAYVGERSFHQQKLCYRSTILSLYKLGEWYDAYHRLVKNIDETIHNELAMLKKVLGGRKIDDARNAFVAHIQKGKKTNEVMLDSEIKDFDEIVKRKGNMNSYFDWIIGQGDPKSVWRTLIRTRDAIVDHYGIARNEIFR